MTTLKIVSKTPGNQNYFKVAKNGKTEMEFWLMLWKKSRHQECKAFGAKKTDTNESPCFANTRETKQTSC